MERRCGNCKYHSYSICDDPCSTCRTDKDNWELRVQLTPDAYQEDCLRTEPESIKNSGMVERLTQGVLGLTGEAGECADLLKKYKYQGHELDREHFAKELGDVAWYLAVAADAIGCTLEYIFELNMKKRKERYPEGFDSNKSLYRAEGDV